jgi:hypothetical protein
MADAERDRAVVRLRQVAAEQIRDEARPAAGEDLLRNLAARLELRPGIDTFPCSRARCGSGMG